MLGNAGRDDHVEGSQDEENLEGQAGEPPKAPTVVLRGAGRGWSFHLPIMRRWAPGEQWGPGTPEAEEAMTEPESTPASREGGDGSRRPVILVVAVILFLASGFVFFSLQRPEPPTFVPSPVEPAPAGERLVGPRTYTVDASDPDRWTFFSFARGSVVEHPGPIDWDLAFRRFRVIVNGGDGFQGMGGALSLGSASLDGVPVVPEGGYEGTVARGDSVNPALERWYDYSFFSHLLSPRPEVYAVRTADGRYALVEIIGYYCPGALPGCVTFRYLYQGAGGREMRAGRNPATGSPVR